MNNPRKILFLCVHNSARSQMAEAILNAKRGNDFVAYSAGSQPDKEVHRMALKLMNEEGRNVGNQNPKSMENFINDDFDFIITLCDKMKEQCPTFPDKPIYAHWGVEDPAKFEGSDEEKEKVFRKTYRIIANRINRFLNLPIDKLDRAALELKMKEIGENIE